MGVAMDMNYRMWDTKSQSDKVGWPLPTKTDPLWPYQKIAKMALELKNAGFTAVRLPPSCECGAGIYSDGYDLFNNYSIDNTAFGSGEMLRQCVAMIHTVGMDAYGDLVLHQYGGGRNYSYQYPGANPKIKNGRFPKTPSCFVGPPPSVNVDPVPNSEGNFGFGDMVSYVNSTPKGYMHDGAIAAAQWLTKTIDFDGYRIDDVKGTNGAMVYDLITAKGISDLYVFGEYFTGTNSELSNWVHGYEKGLADCLDFGFHFNVGDICNNNSHSWMGKLSSIGYCNVDAAHAVTFIESADTDNSDGEQVIWNKILGYAIMLTFPGYPHVYYRDWADDPGCYNLKHEINNLVWIHEHLANGEFVPRLDNNPQVFVHERLGYNGLPGCLCAFNNDQYNTHTVTVQTSYGPNVRLHEYTGHYSNDIWTDWSGNATLTVPKNNNGRGYLVFGLWIDPPGFNRPSRPTTQVFYGAADLVTPPAPSNGTTSPGRVWVAKGSNITTSLTADRTGWTEDSTIDWQIVDPDGNPAGGSTLGVTGNAIQAHSKAAVSGWHVINLTASQLPTSGSDYDFTITYTAPTTI